MTWSMSDPYPTVTATLTTTLGSVKEWLVTAWVIIVSLGTIDSVPSRLRITV